MLQTILEMFVIVALGVGVRRIGLGGLPPEQLRRGITDVVFYVLLPALVLLTLWRAELGWSTFKISALAITGVLAALALSRLLCRLCALSRRKSAALMLAAAFPNVTYLGLPVLENTFGPQARSIAIQYDLFACTPLLLTLGILVAQRYGDRGPGGDMFTRLLKVPPLWAALIAVALNLAAVPVPAMLASVLDSLASAVVPLMLLALGMGLFWPARGQLEVVALANPVIIQLLLMPLLVFGGTALLGLEGWVRTAVVLEAAMPSMVIGIVLCDRYGLDSALYAMTVTVSTLLSLLTLPLWYQWASGGF
ncbi:auxin efflux carrier [Thiohalobacter thiocyanaticus]|uniref:Auxin efflux carrier n=1 Tax=Thiohalobacter thiocyanaticus TaxID=585455 RepID=A0A1Z4VRK0_9GAMM|nr:AEC family transporter [Thiohalobacter thiocyanaticus]BAZ93834.1 auxin efflux carrier [Thiohalobacter thiocyanaticus]